MGFLGQMARKGGFGVAGLAATHKDTLGDIARNGGFGLLGLALAKKRREQERSRPMDERAPMPPRMELKKGGKVKKMAKGGSTASKRADGCATKGKTKGRFV